MTAGARLGTLVGVLVMLIPACLPSSARRIPAPKVAPVEHTGIRYVAPNTNGRAGFVEAWDIRTGRKLWTKTLFTNRINPRLEEDVQWVYIKTLRVKGNTLIATDERGRRHQLALPAQKPSPVHIHEYLRAVPFLLPGTRLAIGWTSLGDPMSAFEKLYVLEAHAEPVRIKGTKDLVGRVRVVSADRALRYVRLFTSPATVRAFELPVWLEVVPSSQVDDDFVFGRRSDLYTAGYVADLRRIARMKDHRGSFGVIPDTQWKQSGLRPPSVRKTPDGYVVTRSMVKVNERSVWGTGIVQQVAETVSPDGITRRSHQSEGARSAQGAWPARRAAAGGAAPLLGQTSASHAAVPSSARRREA